MTQKNAYRKSALVFILSLFAVTGSFAQFSLGAELALPMGNFGDAANTGFGGSVRYDGQINDNLAWGGYFGYQTYSYKGNTSYNLNMMPIMAGVKYYFTEMNNGFYGGLDLGVFIASTNVPGATSESKFGFTPNVGYRLSSFDLGLRYNLITDGNNLAFRVAYVFGASK